MGPMGSEKNGMLIISAVPTTRHSPLSRHVRGVDVQHGRGRPYETSNKEEGQRGADEGEDGGE